MKLMAKTLILWSISGLVLEMSHSLDLSDNRLPYKCYDVREYLRLLADIKTCVKSRWGTVESERGVTADRICCSRVQTDMFSGKMIDRKCDVLNRPDFERNEESMITETKNWCLNQGVTYDDNLCVGLNPVPDSTECNQLLDEMTKPITETPSPAMKPSPDPAIKATTPRSGSEHNSCEIPILLSTVLLILYI